MAATDFIQPAVAFVGILIAAGLTVYQVQRAVAPRRTRLKHDMEILKLARELDVPRAQLEKDVLDQVSQLYGDTPKEWSTVIVLGVLPGIFVFLAFAAWTAYLLRDGFTWWAVLTGFFAFAGIGQLIEVWERLGPKKEPSKPPEPAAPSDQGPS